MTDASASPSNPRRFSRTATTARGPRPPFAPLGTLTSRGIELLDQRGLDVELCCHMGLESAAGPDGGDDWIAIPYIRGGQLVGRKYRRILKREDMANFSADKGSVQCWWNHDVLGDPSLADQPLIVTEGELDALVALQVGFCRVISVPNGAPEHEIKGNGKYGFIADTLEMMGSIREIILATDNDAPGIVLMHDLAKRLGRGRCKFITYPQGGKDLNEILLGYGRDAVAYAIQSAQWVIIPGLCKMNQLLPIPDPVPLVTGLHGMADHFRMRLGDMSVLTGIPGTGKTTLINDIACRMARRYGWHTCFASPELTPQIDHSRMLRTWFNEKPADEQTDDELAAADEFINEWFTFIIEEDDEDYDLDRLLDLFASSIIRYDTKLCIIDPWNELDHAKPKDWTMTDYVGKAIRLLKRFAKKWQIHMMVVAHPAKMPRAKDGSIPCPTLYDISDSSHWYNKPDVGLVLHSDENKEGKECTMLKVVKSRYHDKIGRPGTANLSFSSHTARFGPA